MAYKRGQSGNPRGRPPNPRALSNLLGKGADSKFHTGGMDVEAKELVAQRIWQGLATGVIDFGEGRQFELDANQWVSLLKFTYAQVDGPPPQELELAGAGGGPLKVKIEHVAPRNNSKK